MFVLGIDFGASYTDLALLKDGKLVACDEVLTKKYSPFFVKKFLKRAKTKPKALKAIKYTGRPQKKFELFGNRAKRVSEVAAVGFGARFLSNRKKFLAVNVGTGTPFVFVDGFHVKHVGGTGVGGGTLEGLGKLLLGRKASELEALARKGSNRLDLTVFDVARSRVGVVPANATASNFGKVETASKARNKDVAASLIRLAAESVGVSAAFAARSMRCKEIVFTGRVVARNALFRKHLKAATKLFGCRTKFPKHAESATAIGAALA